MIEHVIYIATTPDRLWEALTNNADLKEYWGDIQSAWTAGSGIAELDAAGKRLWQGDVLRNEPPRILAYTFDAGEIASEITFELREPDTLVQPGNSIVCLTLSQAGLLENSSTYNACKHAWPEILSSLKTYLETGRPPGFLWKH